MTLFCTYQDAPQCTTCGASTGAEATHAVLDYQCRGHWTSYSQEELGPIPSEFEGRVILFCARHAHQTAETYNREGR
jgi:hypothetical protein